MSPDTEVKQIMTPRSTGIGARPRTSATQELQSPASTSRPSSRASSRSSRPPSVAGSDVSETSEPEVFTTMKTETRTVGGRPTTTVTYQTHQTQLRTLTVPTSASGRTTTPTKIPRTSTPRKPKMPK
ncbi:hypothetical protein NP493_2g13212 [Ridgeia piscesae]|uniref:Uncharacterized protein n=1 Tax=Ridgeia piscesae TaxID=27915 RepID=A0AAD9PGJ6_RIDPI|nr:hypothetical protein NP493_2g13212 [Ridgeia piscesae]